MSYESVKKRMSDNDKFCGTECVACGGGTQNCIISLIDRSEKSEKRVLELTNFIKKLDLTICNFLTDKESTILDLVKLTSEEGKIPE